MNPPLRTQADLDAVLEALADGTVDAIATDHAPHPWWRKDVEFDIAAYGIIGLETAFSVGLALVRAGVLSERRLVEALTIGPARTFGLAGGRLLAKDPADVAILDPEARWRVEPLALRSRSKNSPWKGKLLAGRCCYTIVGGRIVHGEVRADR